MNLTDYAKQNARVKLTLRCGDELITTLRWEDPIATTYSVCAGSWCWQANGAYYASDSDPRDIISVEPATPPARKVVQIAVRPESESSRSVLYALCDDGSIHGLEHE